MTTPEGIPFLAFSSSDHLSVEEIDYYEIRDLDNLASLGHAANGLVKIAAQLLTYFP